MTALELVYRREERETLYEVLLEVAGRDPKDARCIGICYSHYCCNLTVREIAKELGVGTARIYELKARGLRVLRHPKYQLEELKELNENNNGIQVIPIA